MSQGIMLKLTHAGNNSASILIADVFDGTSDLNTSRRPGSVYVPVGGSVELVYANSVAKSFEVGDIRSHITNGYITATFKAGDAFGDAVAQPFRIPFAVIPGATVKEFFWAPTALKVLSIQAYLEVAAVSAGVYTVAVQHGPDAGLTNLLSAATFNLKTLVAQTPTTIPLTATAADLAMAVNRRVTFTVASDNADLVASGLSFQVKYGLR